MPNRNAAPPTVVRRQVLPGRKGTFCLCTDATNGRIYYRKHGEKTWRRFLAPPSEHMRLKLSLGKRGLFCLCGNGRAGELWWRPFNPRKGTWRRMQGPPTR